MFSFKVSALILSLCFVSFLTFVVTSTVHAQSDQQIVKYKNLTLDLGLAQLNHPDHSIITYPNLGHEFYPSSQWFTQNGPIPEYVLADIFTWLGPRSGFTDFESSSLTYLLPPTSPKR